MRIPRFWTVVEGSATGPQGQRLFRRVWGWSMSSAAEAFDVAQDRLRSAITDLRTGSRGPGAYYPRVPLREPILDELLIDGEQALVVTRNRYGAEILNTDRLLIADIDLPELEDPDGGLIRRLFRRAPRTSEPAEEPAVVTRRLDKVTRWGAANEGYGVAVYRTASGLRVFVTGVSEPATSPEGGRILDELGADPIYRELCRTHGTFRARLTPKPWRLPGLRAPRERWPYADETVERRFQRWLAAYEVAGNAYAVCRHLATFGPAPSTLEANIIQRHDDRTRVAAPLPLA